MLNIFISGLERQSGKTLVAAGLAGTMQSLNYSTRVFKPIQTCAKDLNGFSQSQDLAFVKRIDSNIETTSSYMFKSSYSPLVGAYDAGIKNIDLNKIYNDYYANLQLFECNIIEGSNSISNPIGEKFSEIDIVKTLNIPLVLVVNPKKSNIDNVILGVRYIQNSGVAFQGIIVNDYDEDSENLEEKYYPEMIKEFTGEKIIGTIPHYDNVEGMTPDTLIGNILTYVKIEDLFGVRIAKLI